MRMDYVRNTSEKLLFELFDPHPLETIDLRSSTSRYLTILIQTWIVYVKKWKLENRCTHPIPKFSDYIE